MSFDKLVLEKISKSKSYMTNRELEKLQEIKQKVEDLEGGKFSNIYFFMLSNIFI